MIPTRTLKGLVAPRFWSKVDKTRGDCWLWTTAVTHFGYGRFRVGNISYGAHRVAYELSVGQIPPGLFVLHRCDVPACVNPAHLFLGTHDDNMADKMRKGRQCRRTNHGSARLTETEVGEIKGLLGVVPQRAIAALFGVAASTIGMISNGTNWRDR